MNTANSQSSASPTVAIGRGLSRVRLTALGMPVLWLLLLLMIFFLQSGGTGFWGKHHGWVSSHGLAIMSKADLEHYFVGYALVTEDPSGQLDYQYFDRYPVFFSAFGHALMSLTDDLPTRVFLMRQWMNLLFLLTMAVCFLLVRRLVGNPYLAFAVTVLSFSSYYLLYYRDMIHFDQPALLDFMLLLYAILRYKADDERRLLYPVTILAISIGRGYASYAVLGPWAVFEALGLLRQPATTIRQKVAAILRHDSTRALMLALVLGAAFLSYNIVIEAVQRGVPLTETSIVSSALSRLPVGSELGRNPTRDLPDWPQFAALEFDRIVRWVLPFKLDTGVEEISQNARALIDQIPLYSQLLFGLMLTVIAWFIAHRPRRERLPLLLTAVCGIFWLFFMINLSFEHDYTTMYAVGTGLLFYVGLFAWLKNRPRLIALLVVASLALFYASNQRLLADFGSDIAQRSVYTADFNQIAHAIQGRQRHIFTTYRSGYEIDAGSYYALGFYLADDIFTPYADADYVITSHPYYATPTHLMPGDTQGLDLLSHTLTPDNLLSFLFDRSAAEHRELPDDLRDIAHFGSSFSLQKWILRASVEVQPCQRLSFESWWQAASRPSINYSLTLALTNSDGQGIAAADTDLTISPTTSWISGAYYLDARTLTVPCDIQPGEYPLVTSVYDPRTVASLPATLPDGTPLGDYFYLTTLFVK